jgi:hypothetical protein
MICVTDCVLPRMTTLDLGTALYPKSRKAASASDRFGDVSWGGCRMGALCDLVAGKMTGFTSHAFYKGYCGLFCGDTLIKTPHRTHGF